MSEVQVTETYPIDIYPINSYSNNSKPIKSFVIPKIEEIPQPHVTRTLNIPKPKFDWIIPKFEPLEYNPKKMIYVKKKNPSNTTEPPPAATDGNVTPPEIKDPPCPSPTNLRVGDIRNSESREKVIGHKMVDNKCIEIYADTTWVDKYVPKMTTVSTTFGITIVATSAAALTPTLLNKLIKPAFKQLINKVKKLTGKKTKILSVAERIKAQRELRDLKK